LLFNSRCIIASSHRNIPTCFIFLTYFNEFRVTAFFQGRYIMAHDVFISYATEDKTIADAVCAGLEKDGIRCWIAPRDILPSEDYDDALISAITHARVMVVIYSSNIFQSQYVKSEIERGFSKGLIIAPFRIEAVDPKGGLELYLGRKHWLDAMTPPLEAHISKLASTMHSLLDKPGQQPDQKPTEPAPAPEGAAPKEPALAPSQPVKQPAGAKSTKSRTIFAVAGGVALLILICAAILAFALIKYLPGISKQVALTTTPGALAYSTENPPVMVTSAPNVLITENPVAPPGNPPAGNPQTTSGAWQLLDSLPRNINMFTVDPQNPKIVYAATGDYTGAGAGVYKSEDAGLTWKSATNGLPNFSVLAVGLLPGESPLLLASLDNSNDLYASSDGATSWAKFSTPSSGGGASIVSFYSNSSSKRILALIKNQGLMGSDNNGQSWNPLGDGLPKDQSWGQLVLSLAVDPGDSKIVYAGSGGFVGQGQGVYKSTDGGDTFAPANKGMLDFRITALAVDPLQNQTVYAGGDSGDLFKSSDGGQSWTNLKDRLTLRQYGEPRQIRSIQIDPANGTIYVLGDNSGLLYSNDGGDKWLTIGLPPGADQPQFSTLGVIFGDKPVFLTAIIGVTKASAWRYGEGQPVSSAAPTPAPTSNTPEKTIQLTGNWQSITDLPRQISSILIDPADPKLVYAAASDMGGSTGGLYKSQDGGLSWKSAASGLNNLGILALASSASQPSILYALAGVRGDIYSSRDNAQSWSLLGNTGLFGGFEPHFYTVPSNVNKIFLIASPGGALSSDNSGQTWIPIGAGLPKDPTWGVSVMCLAFDASDPKIMFAGTGGGVGGGQGVFKSTDGGESWTPSNKGMLDFRITALAVDPHQSQVVFAGSDSGDLFKSSDGGQNWTNLKDRLALRQYGEPRQIRSIQIDPTNGIIYVLGDNSGLLYSGNGGDKWRMLGNPPGTEQPRFTSLAIAFSDNPTFFVSIMDSGGVWRFAPAQ
jgi:photosystem II stability/assembly factor-like uncharacterized protein